MPIKRYKAEQIVTILRQIEVGIGGWPRFWGQLFEWKLVSHLLLFLGVALAGAAPFAFLAKSAYFELSC